MNSRASLIRLAAAFLTGIVVAAAIFAGWHWLRHSEPPISPTGAAIAAYTVDSHPPAALVGDAADLQPQPVSRPAATSASDLVRSKLRQWMAESDPAAAVRLLQELTALLNDQNVAEIIRSLSPDELGTAFGNAALERWLNLDAPVAADWIATRADANSGQAHAVARRLLADREGFEDYCARLPEGEWKQNVIGAAGFELVNGDPARAAVLAARLNPGDAQTGLMQAAAFEWVRQDAKAAMDWAGQTKDAGLREQLIASAAKGYASIDPRQAAEWLTRSVKSPDLLEQAAASIVQSWAGSDPVATAEWVIQFPEGNARRESLDNLISLWASSDFQAAANWVAQLPANSLRNDAAAILERVNPARTGGTTATNK